MVGAAGIGSGGVAVFVTEVEAGPVALLLVGAVFLFVAMGGRLPTRLKVGENEASWEQIAAIQEYVAETVEEASADEKPEEIARVGRLAAVAPDAAAPALEQAAYEQYALRAIWGFVSQIDGVTAIGPPQLDADSRADMVIQTSDPERRAYIVIRASLNEGETAMSSLIRRLRDIPSDGPIFVVSPQQSAPSSDFARLGVLVVPLERGRTGSLKQAISALRNGLLDNLRPRGTNSES